MQANTVIILLTKGTGKPPAVLHLVCGHHSDSQVVGGRELGRLSGRCACHARQLGVAAEKVLQQQKCRVELKLGPRAVIVLPVCLELASIIDNKAAFAQWLRQHGCSGWRASRTSSLHEASSSFDCASRWEAVVVI